MSNEGIAVPGEESGSALSPVEAQARQKGWRPLDEFKGNADDWVDAKEFVGREKLFGKIRELKGEVHRQQTKFDRDMEVVSKHLAETEERAYKRALKELDTQHKAAIRADDDRTVDEIERQKETLEREHKAALAAVPKPSPNSGPTPAFVEFQERNQWFELGTNGPANEMTEDAISIGTGYAAANPTLSQQKVFEHVEKKIKKMYPELAEGERVTTKTRSDPVVETGSGGNRNAAEVKSKKLKITRSDLTEPQRKIMDTLIARGALKEKAAKNKVSQETQYLMDIAENS